MKLVAPEHIGLLDRRAMEITGIPGIVLMENAAFQIVNRAREMLNGCLNHRVLILSGKGNNGGDALAVARHLINMGFDVQTAVFAEKGAFSGDAKINLEILDRMGHKILYVTTHEQAEDLECEIINADLIIDGIFGTGIKNEIKGLIKWIIQTVNRLAKKILSIDIPSGIHGETGEICGVAIKADVTVTFCLPKIGLVVHPGSDYAGELITADISIPESLKDSVVTGIELIDPAIVSAGIPERKSDSHKGLYGRLLVITGSPGMTGAGCLSAGAALKSGIGLVYLAVPDSLSTIYETSVTEAIVWGMPASPEGFSIKALDMITDKLKNINCIVIGPGLGTGPHIPELVQRIIQTAPCPVVLDADAINAVSIDTEILKKTDCDLIITPHPGEMARLINSTIEDVQKNRIGTAKAFAEKNGVTVVLKGSRTVIAFSDGEIYINPTGNSGLATAGTGDVLAGMIGSFIAQGVDIWKAVPSAVYLHGFAGDMAADELGEHGMIASDVTRMIPGAIMCFHRIKGNL